MTRKRFGVTVNAYLDGQGYDSDVGISCDNTPDTQWKCPFAMCEIIPMKEGSLCTYRDNGMCRYLAAQLDGLEAADRMIKNKIKEIKEQMED